MTVPPNAAARPPTTTPNERPSAATATTIAAGAGRAIHAARRRFHPEVAPRAATPTNTTPRGANATRAPPAVPITISVTGTTRLSGRNREPTQPSQPMTAAIRRSRLAS